MPSAPPSRRTAAGNGSSLRFHPRGPPPSHTNHASPPPATSVGYPYVPVRHRSRMSPRQVKLHSIPLREQVSSNFRHELFQFHQLLRDAIEANNQDQFQHVNSQRSEIISRDRSLLELLTSDRGDAVMKEFFAQWQRFRRRTVFDDPLQTNGEDDGSILWEVLETFFANLPFVVSEDDAGGAGSSKAFSRYIDSLKSLRDLLITLLFKHPTSDVHDAAEDDSDEEIACGLQSSIGLGFGLNFSAGRNVNSPRFVRQSSLSGRAKGRIPFYLYCQQLKDELEALRRRVPHRSLHSPGVASGILVDAGLLQDNTVMLLVDFWALPRDERLAFFCQIASQANEQDASAILRVFLDNCTTQSLIQIWEALQQSPQFRKMLLDTKLQFEPGTGDKPTAQILTSTESEKWQTEDENETSNMDKPLVWRGSQRGIKKRGRRSTRFVDLSGITEAFDDNEGGGDCSDENDGEIKNTGGDPNHDNLRFQKFRIRERRRLSLSGPSDQPNAETQNGRRKSFRRSDLSHRRPKTPIDRESTPLLELLHNDLTEVIKMEDGPNAYVMNAVWQLLEALDGRKMHESKSGYHRRHVPLPAPSPVQPLQPQQQHQQIVNQTPRTSIHTPFSAEQQFLMKLDQLQSMLVALGDVRVHTMSTETITGAYRRIPILAKLFAAITDTSLGAAGVDTARGGMSKIVSSYGKTQHLSSSWQEGGSKEKVVDPLSESLEASLTTTGDKVREDVEAMSLLLVKISKFVRSLAPLVDNEDLAHTNMSTSDDVLTIMGLATKLENASALTEAPGVFKGGKGKRRLSLAADREVPVLLAVQTLARSNDFNVVSQLIATSVEAKMTRVRTTLAEADADDDDEDDEGAASMEGDEEVLRIVKNIRRASAKGAHIPEVQDHKQTHTQGGGVQIPSRDGDSIVLRSGKGDIQASIKNAAAMRGIKLFSVDILLRIVNQLYRDNYETMVSTLQYGNRRMEFSEFIYDWHIRKYGLKTLAQRHLLKLIQSLRKYEKKSFLCQLYPYYYYFVPACHSHAETLVENSVVLNDFDILYTVNYSPLGFHEHKFILGLLSRWSFGTFLGGSKHRVELPKRQFKVRITFAISTVLAALREKFGVYARGMDALGDCIRAQARTHDEEFIRESDLLTLCVDEFESQRALLEKVLGAVYQAGDVNGDGNLEFDEFASVVTNLSPTVDDRFLHKVFAAAHDFTKPRRISFGRFLDVILLERFLSSAPLSAAATGIARTKNAAAASTTGGAAPVSGGSSQMLNNPAKTMLRDEQEEAYQFELLRETWAHDSAAVTQVLQTSITHAPTAKSLAFRVAFLDQLLDRRVDSKTAWLCHRQIMREIARYQHLDAVEIDSLRRKEQQFKKAVRAIRNVQRFSALFGVTPAIQDETSDVDTQDASPNYTAAVQLSLDDQAGVVNVADVAALENELRETFLERADEGAIDDYMTAMQHLRRMSVKQQSLQLEDLAALRTEEALSEENEESETDDDDEE